MEAIAMERTDLALLSQQTHSFAFSYLPGSTWKFSHVTTSNRIRKCLLQREYTIAHQTLKVFQVQKLSQSSNSFISPYHILGPK